MPVRSARLFTVKHHLNFLQPPTTTDPDQQNRYAVLNTLFLGTLAIVAVALVIVSINYFVLRLRYVAPRLGIITATALLMTMLYAKRQRYYRLASYGLLAFYMVAATAVAWTWSAETPVGVLLFALVIIFSGILLGARYALYATVLSVIILILLTWLAASGAIRPDMSWGTTLPGPYDIAVFAIILGNLALVSWLFNRSMEQSLHRAQQSEHALRRQKQLLEVKVVQRTREVQTAHLERVQEMYRFAELGQLSVGLLHDVANYLSVLSLDIEDLKQAHENRSVVMRRVQQSIRHLNSLISQVRSQVKDESATTRFNIADELDQVIKLLEYKAASKRVTLQRVPTAHNTLWYTGSINHFWQIMTNIISNAIDAYEEVDRANRMVLIRAESTEGSIIITVTDYGIGISPNKLQKIFEPFYSSKKHGTGIGLAITKRMIEKGFGGTIKAACSPKDGTTFTLTLPIHEAVKLTDKHR